MEPKGIIEFERDRYDSEERLKQAIGEQTVILLEQGYQLKIKTTKDKIIIIEYVYDPKILGIGDSEYRLVKSH